MCVIAYVPKGKPITNDVLKRCYKANGDSIGYMFAHDNKLRIEKFLAFKPFLKKFRMDFKEFGSNSDFTIHFRIATSGKIDLDNAHPFLIDQDHAFVHNGVITGLGNHTHSDTNEFRTKILAPLFRSFPDAMEEPALEELIRGYFGSYNKLVFQRADGESWILNDKGGSWVKGLWFSNTYWDNDYSAYGHVYHRGYTEWEGDDVSGWPMHDRTQIISNKKLEAFPASPPIPAKPPEMLSDLIRVPCSGCGALTIQQDKLCNECWKTQQVAGI